MVKSEKMVIPVLLLHAPKKTPRQNFWRVAFDFTLFFVLLFSSLTSGNLFFEYTQALAENAKIIRVKSPIEIAKPIFVAFKNDSKKFIARMTIDTLAEFPPQPPAEKKTGVYIHMNNVANKNFLAHEIEKLKKLDNPAIVFDVKGSLVYFNSNSEIAKKNNLVSPIYDLSAVVEQLKSAGVYSIARVITLKDPKLAMRNKNTWLTNPRNGKPVPEWVDPTNTKVLEYNRQIISEIIVAGVDEINLDFIRYPEKFTSAWLEISGQEKIENILNFVKMVRSEIKSRNPNAILSIDTFAILAWDLGKSEAALGQDILELSKLADIIAPMLYPATFSHDNPNYFLKNKSFEYSTVFLTLEKYKNILSKSSKKIRPWIQGYYNSEKEIREQIEAVFDAKICGFTVWDIQNDYSETYKILDQIELPIECRN